MVSLPSPLASRWQNPSASTAGCRPGTPESTYPHHHCLCGFCKGATWAQTPILLPLTEPTLTEAGVGGGHRPGLPKNPAPSNTRSSHHSYCRHILHHRPPPVMGTADTMCPGDSRVSEPSLLHGGGRIPLSIPLPPNSAGVCTQLPKEIWSKNCFLVGEVTADSESECLLLCPRLPSTARPWARNFLSLSFHIRNTGKTIVTMS